MEGTANGEHPSIHLCSTLSLLVFPFREREEGTDKARDYTVEL